MQKTKEQLNRQGYITLISMLVIAVAGTALVAATLFNGAGAAKTSITASQSQEARLLAETCAEKALQAIWQTDSYTGSDNLSLGQGSCTYNVSGANVPKTVSATGTVGPVVRKISLTIDSLHPYVNVSAWQDVP